MWKRDIFLILSTSISGTYHIGRVTMMNKRLFVLQWQILMFLSSIIIFSAVSFFFQYRYHLKKEADNGGEEEDGVQRNRQPKNYWANAPQNNS